MNIERFVNPSYESNTYVVYGRDGVTDIVIDPGNPDIVGLCDWLAEKSVKPCTLVLTHGHADHIAGVEPLREALGCRVLCTRACSEVMIDARRNLSLYRTGRTIECAPPEIICEDIGWKLGGETTAIELIPTPGHTPGSMCIRVGGVLFTGDTLIPGMKTVTKLPGGNKAKLRESIDSLFARFGGDTQIYPGHGDSFRMSRETIDRALGVGG